MNQFVIIHTKTNQVMSGTNSENKKMTIDLFTNRVILPCSFDMQKEYKVVKIQMVKQK